VYAWGALRLLAEAQIQIMRCIGVFNSKFVVAVADGHLATVLHLFVRHRVLQV
jgi:hypothetical protein